MLCGVRPRPLDTQQELLSLAMPQNANIGVSLANVSGYTALRYLCIKAHDYILSSIGLWATISTAINHSAPTDNAKYGPGTTAWFGTLPNSSSSSEVHPDPCSLTYVGVRNSLSQSICVGARTNVGFATEWVGDRTGCLKSDPRGDTPTTKRRFRIIDQTAQIA